MEGAILLIVAVGALGAFATGIVLLVLYFRAGRSDQAHQHEPVVYGNLVQCPKCGYMNPLESAACLNPNCRAPLPRPRGYQPAPPQFQQTYMGDQPQYQPPPTSQYPAQRPATPPPQAPQQRAQPEPPRPAPVQPGTQPEPAGPMPQAWLEGLSGTMQGQHMTLQQADTLIGRSTVCDVQIFDPKVSRKHLRIRYGNGAFFMQDQQSSRGTFINGERVMAQRLNDGDEITIGDTVLRFHAGR